MYLYMAIWPGIVVEVVGHGDSHAKSRYDTSLWLDYSTNNLRPRQQFAHVSRSATGFQPRLGYPMIRLRP